MEVIASKLATPCLMAEGKRRGGNLYFSPGPQTFTQMLCLLAPPSFHLVHLQGGCVPIHRSAPSRMDSSHSRRPTYSPYCVLGTMHSPEHILLWMKPCWHQRYPLDYQSFHPSIKQVGKTPIERFTNLENLWMSNQNGNSALLCGVKVSCMSAKLI